MNILRKSTFWNVWIKTILILAFVILLLQRLYTQEDLRSVWQQLVNEWYSGNVWLLIAAVLLMPVNWMVEVTKWRMLMRPAVDLSWRRAIAGVLSGITFSLFTPNRIGEYGGRMLFVDARHNWHAVLASLTGSFAQNLIHISVGCVALTMMVLLSASVPLVTGRGVTVLLLLAVCGMWITYLRLPEVVRVMQRWTPPRWMRGVWKALEHVATMARTTLLRTSGLAVVRYMIFSVQYILVLRYCGVMLPLEVLAGGVAVIFLVQTSIPLPPIVDMLARNEVGIFLWAGYGIAELHIIAAGLCVWIINLAFPALCGLFAIASVNILRSLGYENLPHIRTALRRGNPLDGPA